MDCKTGGHFTSYPKASLEKLVAFKSLVFFFLSSTLETLATASLVTSSLQQMHLLHVYA